MRCDTFRRSEIDTDELATLGDLPELPNGWSTVVRVCTMDGRRYKFARITQEGYIKTVDNEYVRREGNRIEVVGGSDE